MQPNVILCMCDQLRAFEVGCYGNPVIQTPAMDRIAREGVRFETAVSNFPVCMAARSVLLSGQYNRLCTGGVSNVHFPGRPGDFNMPEYPYFGRPHLVDPTLAEVLQSAGYHTRAIGKWHIHSWPNDVGFDEYLIPRVHHCHSGQLFTENGGPEFAPDGFSVDFEAERVESFLQGRRTGEKPFFLYYNISPPHCPLADAPEEFLSMYSPEEIPLRENVDLSKPLANQDYWFKVYRWDYRHYHLHLPFADQLPEGYDLRRLIAEYYGATTWADRAVGRMLNALDQSGLAENTIVIFVSDHGDSLGSHGLVQKGRIFEESIRVPLMIRWPRKIQPAVNRAQVAGLVDLAPTILGLAGAEVPACMHGQNLTGPILGNQSALPDRPHSFIETGGGIGIRTPTHTYFIPWKEGTRELEEHPAQFYDLERDPYQLRNLVWEERESDQAGHLDALLRKWDASIPWRIPHAA